MKKHFVTFYSPGTIVHEYSEKPIDSWDVDKAKEMAKDILERYSATPFGFQFSTRERKDDELDSKVIKKSNMYYLGGTILTLADVKKRGDKKDYILIMNMEGNGYDRVIENTNSWKATMPLEKGDIVLDMNP